MNCLFCSTLPSINLHISVYISLRLIPFCGFTKASKLHQLRWSICNNQPSNQASNQTINQPTINRPNLPPLNIIGKKKMQIQQVNDNKFHLLLLKKKKKKKLALCCCIFNQPVKGTLYTYIRIYVHYYY